MKYLHILHAFYGRPWAILPEKLAEIQAFLAAKSRDEDIPDEQIDAIAAGRASGDVVMAGRVAIVPIMGVISQRASMLERASGGVSAEALGQTLDGLVNDRTVKSIVLHVDSPGGSVYGISELSAKIQGYRGQKKVVAVADSIAASAAYWIASQAQEVNVTPGGQVGSIGVLAAHEDVSKEMEAKGRAVTVISAGKYKGEGSPFAPLTDEAKAELQSKVNHYYGQFVGAVAKGRGVSESTVRGDFGEGRMVTAKEAVSRGMADHVATMEQVLRRLGAESGSSGTSAAMAAARARAVEIS